MVATCGSDQVICLYDVRKGATPLFKNTESQSVIISCDFANDQKHIISTTYAGVLNVTSIETQKFIVKYNSFGSSKTIDSDALHACRSVKGHPLGNVFLVGGENSNVAMIHFDPTAKYESWLLEARGTYEGHSDAIRHIEHNKGGDLMLSACADHSLRIWDLNTTRCMALFAGHTGLVVSLSRSPHKNYLVRWKIPQRYDNRLCLLGLDNLPMGLQRSAKAGPHSGPQKKSRRECMREI